MPLTPNLDLPEAPSEHNVRLAYRPDIDGLRAIAILAVVIFHAFPTVLPGGFAGVDIFFVISGFLISSIIFRSLARGTFSLSEFYAHRVKRIFPALLVVLCFCFAFGWVDLLPEEFSQLGKHMAGGIGFVLNFLLLGEAGYFDTASELKPLMHLWSLSIEEQFYLAYPLLVWSFWGNRKSVAFFIGALALASFTLNVLATGTDPAKAFFLPQYRFWELLAGGMLALVPHLSGGKQEPLTPFGQRVANTRNYLSLVGLGLLALTVIVLNSDLAFPGWWAMLPVAGTLMLIAAGPSAIGNSKVLAHPAMKFVGRLSYPLYLWHWPLLAFARIADSADLSVSLRITAVMLSGTFAWLTYRFIEAPIRFGRPNALKTIILCALAVLVGLVGYKTFDREGFRFRLKNFGDQQRILGVGDPLKSSLNCRQMVGAPFPTYCLMPENKPPEVALIGDSHAGALYPGLSAALGEKGLGLLLVGAPGCPPLADTEFVRGQDPDDRNCMAMINHALEVVKNQQMIKIVVLSLRGPRNMYGTGFGPVEASMKSKTLSWSGAEKTANQPDIFAGALSATVEPLLAAGKRVIIVADWPELGFDPKICLNIRPIQFAHTPAQCVVSKGMAVERNREYRTLLDTLRQGHVGLEIFDPWPLMCDDEACHAIREGQLLYADNNHLALKGSMLVGNKLADMIIH